MDAADTDDSSNHTRSVASSSPSSIVSGHSNDRSSSNDSPTSHILSTQLDSSSVAVSNAVASSSTESSQGPVNSQRLRSTPAVGAGRQIAENILTVPPGVHPYHHYREVANQYEKGITKDWVPEYMSPEDVETYRNATFRRLERIHQLEAEQIRHSRPITKIEQALFMARLDYRIRFYRIFRINDLPTEILTNIFHLVAWSAPDPRAAVAARLWLTSTCRHWRTVAIQDSTLWNAIWFRRPPDFSQAYTWLERAGNAAIDVRINDTVEHPLTLESTTVLINRLFEKLSNIRVLIIVVQDWDPALTIIHALRRVAQEGLPMIMERFELHRAGSAYVQIGTGYEPSFYTEAIPLFGGAVVPSFRYLSLNGVHVDWQNSHLTNLSAFDIRRMPLERVPTLERFRAILQASPDLNKMILDGAGPQWPRGMIDPSTFPVIPLPLLKILVVGDFSVVYGAYLITQFAAPNVLDFTLMNLLGTDYSPFFNALTSKLPSIRTLTIHTAAVSNDSSAVSIFKWLRTIPNLTYLRVINVQQTFLDLFLFDSQLSRPAISGTKSLICDKLAYLEIHSVDIQMVSTWISKRKALGSPLRKVYIGTETVSPLKPEELAPLRTAMRTPQGNVAVQVLAHMQKPSEEEELLR
ncbi:hypothetical protein JR316_0000555 [Psilocybe cubensis]|uniref:Uncharacterized protein n=2 Tax=Psilocybe cubensis TaxID=181762 RepID=A0ACB8HEP4_PSICU|nr:hypothetical protein JR316_0000555 [Psilocybe cubensis]KAH9486490.1 hypothetical protein JR316_0000555 [Psilocybe cubensis]